MKRFRVKKVKQKERKKIPYRIFTDKEIKQWAKDDKLPPKLAKKIQTLWPDIT